MILFMASSGVRIGALSSMQIGHLTPVTFNGLRFMQVLVIHHILCECYSTIHD